MGRQRLTSARLLILGPKIITANAGWQHRFETEQLVREWRAAGARQWRADYPRSVMTPPLAITAWPQTRRAVDTGNAYPTVKAVIDGLTDAGALDNDGPRWVEEVILWSYSTPPADHPDQIGLFVELTSFPLDQR